MIRDNMKVMSVRLDDDLIEKLDDLAKSYTYWRRSDIIRNILVAAFAEMSPVDLYNMIRYHYYKKNVIDAKFEITDELKPYERK